jgi:hypothetical protein
METTELQLDLLRKQKALEEQLLKIEKEQTEEDRKKALARQNFIDNYGRFLKAQENAAAAKQGVSDAKHDALAPGIDDLAGGVIGNGTDRAKAKRILQLEERARKQFASGNTVTEFNSKTQRNEQVNAETLQDRALQMRQGFSKLKTEDQNPFAGAETQLKEANAYLFEIQSLLTPKDSE